MLWNPIRPPHSWHVSQPDDRRLAWRAVIRPREGQTRNDILCLDNRPLKQCIFTLFPCILFNVFTALTPPNPSPSSHNDRPQQHWLVTCQYQGVTAVIMVTMIQLEPDNLRCIYVSIYWGAWYCPREFHGVKTKRSCDVVVEHNREVRLN